MSLNQSYKIFNEISLSFRFGQVLSDLSGQNYELTLAYPKDDFTFSLFFKAQDFEIESKEDSKSQNLGAQLEYNF